MRSTVERQSEAAEKVVRDIRRATQFGALLQSNSTQEGK
jgi:hypothetical protein